MKNIKYLLLVILSYTSISFAQLKPVQYQDGNQILNGFTIAPVKKSIQKPGILILPAWMGIDKLSKDTAENLSKLGYYAFVADIYGEGNYPKDFAQAGKNAGFYKTNYKEYQTPFIIPKSPEQKIMELEVQVKLLEKLNKTTRFI